MGYSVKKAGVAFKAKVETNADFTGQAAGFSAFYIDDATGTKTDVVGAFTEDANALGLYFSPDITIPAVGDYTLVINNGAAGMDNHPTPIVVTNATIDDIKATVDGLETTLAQVAADVDGLEGTDLQDIRDNLTAVKALLDDEDGATVNSVMEFVTQIDAALADGASGLAALSGFTDDIENMLNGTEFLADGTTPNPFYDATNPGVAKQSTMLDKFAEVLAAVGGATDYTPRFDTLDASIAAVQAVVDANKLLLEDAGFGLDPIKQAIDAIQLAVTTHDTDIKALLENADFGLANLKTIMETRFDTVDATLATMDGKLDAMGSAQGFRAFV
jgi:hypothetical protein